MLSSYSLFKKSLKKGTFWYVRFYNPDTKKYFGSYATGIECIGKGLKKKQAQLKAQKMLEELDLNKPIYLVNYALSFWKIGSKYEKYKRLVENSPLSKGYIDLCARSLKKHVVPYKPFKDLPIKKLTTGMIEDWKIWAIEQGAGKHQINSALKALKVPVGYLIQRGELEIFNPFSRVRNVVTEPREKGILTKQEITNLLNVEYTDPRTYFAIMLAVLSGLRRGELRGLLWEDIDLDNGIINVRNNYVDSDGLKGCKWGSSRQVLFPERLTPVLNEIRSMSPYREDKDYILFSANNLKQANNREKPLSTNSLRDGFTKLLEKAGITKQEQKERNLTLHGMRHTFVTMARMAGIPDIAVQAMAGHKSAEMMNHYSHSGQVINLQEYKDKMVI